MTSLIKILAWLFVAIIAYGGVRATFLTHAPDDLSTFLLPAVWFLLWFSLLCRCITGIGTNLCRLFTRRTP